MASLETRLKEHARNLGFELVGIAAATPADGFARLRDWLNQGFAGQMDYMHRHALGRRDPSSILTHVRSIVMVGMNYKPTEKSQENEDRGWRIEDGKRTEVGSLTGRVARYARGEDYHDVLWRRLDQLLGWVQEQVPGCRGRGVVDTAPLLE